MQGLEAAPLKWKNESLLFFPQVLAPSSWGHGHFRGVGNLHVLGIRLTFVCCVVFLVGSKELSPYFYKVRGKGG